jgi:hypothetical protein
VRNRLRDMLTFEMDATIQADPAAVWQAWKPRFEKRPPEEEARNLSLYDLAYGLKIPITLVAVNEMRNRTVEHALPLGKLVIDHWMIPLGDGRVRVGKRYDVSGPMSVPYRLFFAGKFRKSWPEKVAELDREAKRLAER